MNWKVGKGSRDSELIIITDDQGGFKLNWARNREVAGVAEVEMRISQNQSESASSNAMEEKRA